MSQNMKNVSWQQELETSSTPRSRRLRSCASLRAWSLIKQKFGSKWILRQPWKWTRCSELFPNIPTVGITALLFLLIKCFIIFGATAEPILIDKIALAFSRQWKYLEMSASSDEDAGPPWIKVSRQVKSFHTQTKNNNNNNDDIYRRGIDYYSNLPAGASGDWLSLLEATHQFSSATNRLSDLLLLEGKHTWVQGMQCNMIIIC